MLATQRPAGRKSSRSSTAAKKLPHYRVSRDELSGDGVRLGTAYRLKTGDVVYVPDDAGR